MEYLKAFGRGASVFAALVISVWGGMSVGAKVGGSGYALLRARGFVDRERLGELGAIYFQHFEEAHPSQESDDLLTRALMLPQRYDEETLAQMTLEQREELKQLWTLDSTWANAVRVGAKWGRYLGLGLVAFGWVGVAVAWAGKGRRRRLAKDGTS